MRSTHIAWIGGVLTFAAVVVVGLWRQDSAPAPLQASATPTARQPALAQAGRLPDPRTAAAMVPDPVPESADPPEDGRAMMDAAAADPDPAVRDEAAALSQALAAEAASATE